jgi:hypothetical protein
MLSGRAPSFPTVVAVVASAMLACEQQPTEPQPENPQIAVEQVVSDSVGVRDTIRHYTFTTQLGPHAVYVQAVAGIVSLTVKDAQAVRAEITLAPDTGGLTSHATNTFDAAAGQNFSVDVFSNPPGSAAKFRFQVHRPKAAPEEAPGRFSIGDTVNERIDDPLDFDEFLSAGTAGLEIVAAIEATGSPLLKGIQLSIFDPADHGLGGQVTRPGLPGGITGRLVLPVTGDYRFRITKDGLSTPGNFVGPYRLWTYLINHAPERHAATLSTGVVETGEAIAPAADVDEFTFQATQGADYNVFLQSSALALHADVVQNGDSVGAGASDVSDTAMFMHASGRFHATQTGPITVKVRGASERSVTDTGPYRLYVYPVNPLPEHLAATIVPGDTVSGESIDVAGDVDEFSFSGTAGDDMDLIFQLTGGRSAALRLDVIDGNGTSIANVVAYGNDTSFYQRVTGVFALPTSGTYRVRVAGRGSTDDVDTGPYRFFLYRVQRQPEAAAPSLAFGDSVTTESIDLPGDIDEFTVTVPDSSGVDIGLQFAKAPTIGEQLTAQLVAPNDSVLADLTTIDSGEKFTGSVHVGPGTHIVRVFAGGYLSSMHDTPYRLWAYNFGFRPEIAADTIVLPDTITGEAISPPGDVDEFHFFARKGQHVNLAIQGLAPSATGGGLLATLNGPGTPIPTPFIFLSTGTATADVHDHQTTRLELPGTGWYDLVVSGGNGGANRADVAPYRLAIESVDTEPEHVSASLVNGDSVMTERIDTPGDWDEFTLSAQPGAELLLTFAQSVADGPFPQLTVFDRTSGDTLADQVGQFVRLVGPFTMPASGQVGIAVRQPGPWFRICNDATCGGVYAFTGPYQFKTVAFNRAPEQVPAIYSVGDTVRGEAIDPVGDIDEFMATAAGGARLQPYYRLTANPVPSGSYQGISFEIIDPATGDTLSGRGGKLIGTSTAFNSFGPFTVPASGHFLIRVRGSGLFGDEITTAPYEFFVGPPSP